MLGHEFQTAFIKVANGIEKNAPQKPKIPPNTGNIGRLCAATNTRLHVVGDIGFDFENKNLKRAGLDYWPFLDFKYWRARNPTSVH